MNISPNFTGTYKILSSQNKEKTKDIYNATDKIFLNYGIETTTDFTRPPAPHDILWTIAADDSMDLNIERILSSRGIKYTKKDYTQLFDIDDIKKRIKLPDDCPKEKYSLVEIDTEKFNKAYKAHGFAYIGDSTNVAYPQRYEGVKEYIKADKPIDASIVFVRDDGAFPEIAFQDGRHRYAFMRNMGMDRIPVAMSKESVETAKKYGLI